MGSKAKIAKHILPIILKDRKPDQYYIEPFVGGCNTMDKVGGRRIGSDKNRYLIAMWSGLTNGRTGAREISKEDYIIARNEHRMTDRVLSDFDIGWIGWMGSFNGRFFDGGYSGKTDTRDYISEQIRNTESQIEKLRGVEFRSSSYEELAYPDDSVIYCDPPYRGTKQYSVSKDFNHDHFWQWCRRMAHKGHDVFISEYSAPSDFDCIWEKEITNSMATKNTYRPIEKLFKYTKNPF